MNKKIGDTDEVGGLRREKSVCAVPFTFPVPDHRSDLYRDECSVYLRTEGKEAFVYSLILPRNRTDKTE